LNKKAVTVTLLGLMMTAFLLVPLSLVVGQLVGVNIYQVTPQELVGTVGTPVNIQASIDTKNGVYQVWFGSNLVASNNAEGYYVNANFTVPELQGGNYTITLKDVTENVNATEEFSVIPAYYVKALVPLSPAQLQEGSSVVLNVTVTGGKSGTAYYANITVVPPTPLNMSYSSFTALLGVSQKGTAQAHITYPNATFQPAGSTTDYTGSYQVYLNQTELLATDQFFVGFTDLSQYHRDQTVTIRAIGYQPNEDSTITITYVPTGVALHSETVTASSDGVISASWAVPSNALMGDYNITITPTNTPKLIPDSQLFTVPGYPIRVRTLNLAGGVVPQIVVEALDQATNTIYNATSQDNGTASLNLERGNHIISAYWNNVKVGEINASITGESSFDLACTLTNVIFNVQNKNGFSMPFVNLYITYQYVTTKEGTSKTGSASGQTGLSGTFILNSTLPGISYTINASLYGVVFNSGNNTVVNLPAQPTFQVTILCPSRILTLTILDYNLAAIPNARIELVEQSSGIFYGAVTDNAGKVTVEVTFGKYRLRVYTGNILLNETVVEAFSDTQIDIRCILYNLQVSVKVIDYFGQPIDNVNVMLRGQENLTRSAKTKTDGTARFDSVIGGNMQIIAYLTGKEASYEAVNLRLESPTAIQIKMGKYVLLGPFLIETSLLATLIIVLAVVIVFLSVEVYRRKRLKPGKSES
jgi:hypothetical protein